MEGEWGPEVEINASNKCIVCEIEFIPNAVVGCISDANNEIVGLYHAACENKALILLEAHNILIK